MTYLEELREVIRRLHGADAAHVESVPVKETYRGKTVWEGVVEVFDRHDHPTASRVYAWTESADDPGPSKASPHGASQPSNRVSTASGASRDRAGVQKP
jgi:hypothetical protein